MKHDFDVVIVGGAMAGAGAAALLACDARTSGLRIALLEPRPATAPLAGEPLDLRVSALSRASQQLLVKTGAWDAVLARGAAAYQRMVIWEERSEPGGRDALVFDAAELGEPDLGCIAENRAVQAALTESALARGVVLLRSGLATLTPGPDAIRVATADGREHRAALVVGADGADSAVRAQAGIDVRAFDYGQRAVVTHLRAERPHADTAYQRFLDTGPLALLPLAEGRVSLVWSTTPGMADELVRCDAAQFAERVTAASGCVLGRLEAAAARAAFPLRLLHARRYVSARIALVGDAAHTVHPLAGQGINLAFLDAAALTEVLGEAQAGGDGPGELRVLRRYERWRRSENAVVMGVCDTINRLFAEKSVAIAGLRRFGLSLVTSQSFLRRALVERALGVGGDTPQLARRTTATN